MAALEAAFRVRHLFQRGVDESRSSGQNDLPLVPRQQASRFKHTIVTDQSAQGFRGTGRKANRRRHLWRGSDKQLSKPNIVFACQNVQGLNRRLVAIKTNYVILCLLLGSVSGRLPILASSMEN